ncbi:aspartyl/asparaginyl beta-hydroxylase [Burkholderia paludis]|uniref:Aspartyl/asparaginyl beta-hydroxylase n=1 Tax=Burkholderia paludis TaxID=1506587 RepID=A0A6J5D755_9BURK|nr:hypothetical protein LMG30113_01164 [Burkholderia paludis]VWB13409.1 aspartyl/asparaginyl beta-hydroxylase [Burkholderia paludis]
MFVQLPPGGKLGLHRDPYAGRYAITGGSTRRMRTTTRAGLSSGVNPVAAAMTEQLVRASSSFGATGAGTAAAAAAAAAKRGRRLRGKWNHDASASARGGTDKAAQLPSRRSPANAFATNRVESGSEPLTVPE